MTKRIIFVCMLFSLLLSTLAASLLIRSVASSEIPPTPPTAVYGPNLLTNPGFEHGLAGWTTSAGTAVYSVDSSTYVSGHYSCKGVENSPESLGRLYQDVTNITSPGNDYQISGWIKTSNVTGYEGARAVIIGLDYVNAGGWTPEDGRVNEIGFVYGTQDWAFFQSDVFTLRPMPSDANALRFLFDFNGETGTAWWDNVSLTLVTYPVPVAQGTNVTVFPNPAVNLTFADVTASGTATSITTTSFPPPPSGIVFTGPVWDIITTAKFSGNVTVGISYAGDPPTRMLQTDIVPGDVNHDGVVNWKDLDLILKAMFSRPGDLRWNPNCDLNHNNKIDIGDFLIALRNFGKTSQWKDITTYVDTVNQIVYGSTDHFSYFGIH